MFTSTAVRLWLFPLVTVVFFLTGCDNADANTRLAEVEKKLATLEQAVSSNATRVAILEQSGSSTMVEPAETIDIHLPQGSVRVTYRDEINATQATAIPFDDIEHYSSVLRATTGFWDNWKARDTQANILLAWSLGEKFDYWDTSRPTPTGKLLYNSQVFTPSIPISWEGFNLVLHIPAEGEGENSQTNQAVMQAGLLPPTSGGIPFNPGSPVSFLNNDLAGIYQALGNQGEFPMILLIQDRSTSPTTYKLVIVADQLRGPAEGNDSNRRPRVGCNRQQQNRARVCRQGR